MILSKKTFLYLLVFSYCLLTPVYGNLNPADSIAEKSYASLNILSPEELLSKYISIESITGNEKEAGMFLAEVSKRMGLHVEILNNATDTFNFTASLYPLEMNKPNIVFLNHIDVVPAEKPELWTHPPFSGAIVNDTIWGRGSIDNKGMAIMQLMAMQKFVDKVKIFNYPYNVTLLSVSGEETGGLTGAKIITENYLDKLNAAAVYGEGGSGLPGVLSGKPERKLFGVSVAHKRILWLELTLKMETSGHGSVPPVSYAVQEMVDALNRVIWRNHNRIVRLSEPSVEMLRELGKLERGFKRMALRNIRLFRPLIVPALKRDEIIYSLISNTVTVTGIQTQPGPPNIIPQMITAYLDCRLLPEFETDEFLKKVESWLMNDKIEINIIGEREMAPPTKVDEYYHMMSDAIKKTFSNSEVIPILAPASNDNNYFRAKDIPTYGLLPVYMDIELLESIHNVDERLPVSCLLDGINVYTELINNLFNSKLKEISKN